MKIIAHRGASADAPENTLAAFRLAIEQGADGIEFDVRSTHDGVSVVIHDADLRRTGGSRLAVRETDLAALRTIDIGSWKGPAFTDERIPTLAMALGVVPPHMDLLIELKEGPASAASVLAEVASSPRSTSGNVFMGFDWETCVELRRLAPTARVFGLVPEPTKSPVPLREIVQRARSLGFDGLGISRLWLGTLEKDPGLARQAFGDGGITLSVWTVDNPAEARRWKSLGAAYLTSNRPGRMRRE